MICEEVFFFDEVLMKNEEIFKNFLKKIFPSKQNKKHQGPCYKLKSGEATLYTNSVDFESTEIFFEF